MSCRVLVIDDERTLARNIQSYLARQGYEVRCAERGQTALELLETFVPAVILLDLRLPDADGIELLGRIRALAPAARTLIMTAYASLPTAVLAIKAGADDYIAKPLVLGELRRLIDRVRCAGGPTADQPAGSGLAMILGNAPAITELRQRVERLLALERRSAHTAASVLLLGETGSGKGLVARALHLDSSRAHGPFIELDCSTLPEQLVEDQLFGHAHDPFGEQLEGRPSLIEAADGGTLFLDEISDLGPAAQAKLLKFLETRTVGGHGAAVQARGVDVRVIAATHQQLEQRVRDGRFRADLYFRLRVVELKVPPLRERVQDILPLARAFLAESARRWGRPALRLAPAAEAMLAAHPWPGNVRELRNVVEQAAVLVLGDSIDPDDLALTPLAGAAEHVPGPAFHLPEDGVQIGHVERDMLRQALDRSAWNVTAAARLLGLSRDAVRYRMQKHGLLRPFAGTRGEASEV
jgi:DNA-binding NtrC family response regulator